MPFEIQTAALLLTAFAFAAEAGAAEPPPGVRYIESDPAHGSSGAVLVGDVPLVHTPQLLPLDDVDGLVSPGGVAGQARAVLRRVVGALGPGGGLESLVKL